MQWIIKKIVGTKNERDLKRIGPLIEAVNAKEEEYQQLSEEERQDSENERFAVVEMDHRQVFFYPSSDPSTIAFLDNGFSSF